MKIGSSEDGVLYATRGLTVGAWTPETGFEPRGTLPNPDIPFTGRQRMNYGPLNRHWTKRLLSPVTGWYTTTNVWPIGDGDLLATVGHRLFRSPNGGASWQQVYELPFTSGPMGTLPTSLAVHDDRVFLAEYTFENEPARVLVSDDRGRTWSTHFERSSYRHFHGLFRDPYGDRLWGTTGDTDEESSIGFFEDGEFRTVGGGSQRWRAVGLAFTPDAIIWGMDCSYAETVRVFRLPREEIGTDDPQPETIHVTDSSVFYLETLEVDGEWWVALATAAETGVDDTAPPGSENACSRSARVLAASSASAFETWYELCSFERRRTVNEYLPGLPTASAYVYLEADPAFGLAVNPFNMRDHHGKILSIPPAWFADRGRHERLAGDEEDVVEADLGDRTEAETVLTDGELWSDEGCPEPDRGVVK